MDGAALVVAAPPPPGRAAQSAPPARPQPSTSVAEPDHQGAGGRAPVRPPRSERRARAPGVDLPGVREPVPAARPLLQPDNGRAAALFLSGGGFSPLPAQARVQPGDADP